MPTRSPAKEHPLSDDDLDPVESARNAGLRYVADTTPGIRRERKRNGEFVYRQPDGSPVEDEATLARIKSLAIPPAWTDVWICRNPRGHIQATGRDAKGRKQYRYHPRWREVRDTVKYDRLATFGEALPTLRERVDHDLGLSGLPREKVLATVVRLLDETSIRIGNEEYREQNQSYGLTTLRDRHVRVNGSSVRFEFRGKSGKQHSVKITDRRIARIVKRCQDVPGYELFQYVDDEGQRHTIESEDVNEYLREISGGDFTAKDFRTWNGTVLAARFLAVCEPCLSERQGNQQIAEAIKQVATHLGNTPAVCRKAYVHPGVIDAYRQGCLKVTGQTTPPRRAAGLYALSDEEQAVLDLLRSMAAATREDAAAAPPRAA